MRFKNKLNLNLLLHCCFVLILSSVRAETNMAIVINGNYESDLLLGGKASRLTTKRDFTVTLNGPSWIIDYTNRNSLPNAVDSRVLASCDGTNIYIVHFPYNTADISPGTYLFPEDGQLEYLWLAFISPSVLTNTQGKAKSPFYVDRSIFFRDDYWCRYQWITNIDNAYCRNLMFLSDGMYFGRDNATGELIRTRFGSPFNNGFLLLEEHCAYVTNIMGVVVPEDVQFAVFGPGKTGSSSNDLSTLLKVRCNVSSVNVCNVPRIPVSPPVSTYVYDRRFESMGYAILAYRDTNGIWPSLQNSALNRMLRSVPKMSLEDEALMEQGYKIAGEQLTPKDKQSRVSTMRFLILCFMAIPPILFCIYLMRAFQAKNKPT